jgi:hypothetical protein
MPGGVEEARSADRATLASGVFVPPDVATRLSAAEASRGSGGEVRVTHLEPERFEVETVTPLPSLLVSSQKTFPPYWRLYLDGARVPGFTANGLFLGLELPAGHHRVEGRFLIPRLELVISFLGLITLGAVTVRALGRFPA